MKLFTRILAIPTLLLSIPDCYAAWSTPTNASDGATAAYGVAIAANDLGDVVAVWEDNAAPAIYASVSSNSAVSWGIQIEVGGPSTGANDINPGVAIDPASSKAIASWSSANFVAPAVGEVYASTYSGIEWSASTVISGNGASQNISAQAPATIMNSGGTAAVAWYDAGANEVYVNYYNGSSWAGAQSISTSITGTIPSTGNVSMAANGGNVILVWSETVAGISTIYSCYSSNGGSSWSMPTLVYNTHNAYNPTVSLNASAEAVVTWETDLGAGTFNIYAATSTSGGSWGTPSLIGTSKNSVGMSVFSFPQVSINSSGNAVASWTDWTTDTGPSSIAYATYNGSSWTSASSLGSSNYQLPLTFLNNSGDAVIAGINNDSRAYTIQAFTSTNSGSSWSTASTLISNASHLLFGLTLNSNTAIAAFTAPNMGNQFVQTSYFQFTNTPNAPSTLTGAREANKFPFQTDYYNYIQWGTSSTATVTSYYVFRNGSQIGTVSAGGPLLYRDHNINRALSYTYSVTAVNDAGQSSPITITISP